MLIKAAKLMYAAKMPKQIRHGAGRPAQSSGAGLEANNITNPAVFIDALAAISQGVLIADHERRLIYLNNAFSDTTGYAAEEIIGRTCHFMQGPDSSPATIAAIRVALDAGHTFAGEIVNYKKSGELFWNELTIVPVGNPRGGAAYYVGIIRDVTHKKAAEAALTTLHEHYRFLFDHVQSGVVLHDANTAILYSNAMAGQLLGENPSDILGAEGTDARWRFVREDGSQMPVEEYPVHRAVAARKAVRSLILGVRRDGGRKVTWLLCNAYPVLDEPGKPGKVVVSFTDITELKQAEHALQKSEERLRLVLRGANDAAWDWDLLTDEPYYSPRWWQMIGYQPNELAADALLWQRIIHPEDRSRVDEIFERALRDGLKSYETEFRLRHKDGYYVPVLSRGFILRNKLGEPMRVSGTNTDLTERKRAEKQINRLAFYDMLTGLPNRQLLMNLLHKAMQASADSGQQGALMFIDLDNFKMLNDTRGHDIGDMLLQQIARRLRYCTRGIGAVGRLGGDEFVVLLENLGVDPSQIAAQALDVAHVIRDALGRPYTLARIDYRCTLSIGIAVFDEFKQGVDGILKQADLAMYEAKAAGRNTLKLFDSSMQVAVDERLALENDLRNGLQTQQMALYVQPQVDQAGAIMGAEALIRWCHPQRGVLLPAAFIPLAEATGLILLLGDWVLRKVCQKLASWRLHPLLSQLTLAVNVSVRQFHEADFVDSVLEILAVTGANPARLKLEMTESLLAENIDEITVKMGLLRKQGITFSLDDFGTGYSSLSYLQRLPLDELKIDRSFVRDVLNSPNDAAIARIVIALADNLGLAVIAEGVETQAQREFLASSGCYKYQGFLFGEPVPMAQFEAALGAA